MQSFLTHFQWGPVMSKVPCAILSTFAFVAISAFEPAAARTRYFSVSDGPPNETFTIALSNPTMIAKARQIIAGNISGQVKVSGRIAKWPVKYNAPWHFHLKPASITFITFANTTCLRGAATSEIEANIQKIGTPDYSPLGFWCPLGSRVAAEISANEALHGH